MMRLQKDMHRQFTIQQKSSDSINEVREVLNILMENYEEEEEFRKILEDPNEKISKKKKNFQKNHLIM